MKKNGQKTQDFENNLPYNVRLKDKFPNNAGFENHSLDNVGL